MNLIDTVFEWLLAATLRASVLAVVILGIQYLLRRGLPAAWRHALWLPMLAVLILPVLPETPFALFPQKAAAPVLTEATVKPAAPAVNAAPAAPTESTLTMTADLAPALPSVPTPAIETAPIIAAAPIIEAAPIIAAAPAIQAAPAPTSNVNFLAILWLAGAGVFLGAGWIGYHRSMRRIRATATVPDRMLLAAIAEAAHEAGLSRAPRTWVSAAVSSPAVTGFLRPLLLLPAGFPAGFSATETRLILLHEFSHLKRLDLPLNWLMCLLQAMHWFNPLLWFAFARMRADRESACDARVLSIDATDRRAEYGCALLKLQCAAPSQALSLGFVGIFEKGSEIKARIREISAHRPGRAAWRLTGASILTLLMAFGVTKGQEAEPIPAAPAIADRKIDNADGVHPGKVTVSDDMPYMPDLKVMQDLKDVLKRIAQEEVPGISERTAFQTSRPRQGYLELWGTRDGVEFRFLDDSKKLVYKGPWNTEKDKAATLVALIDLRERLKKGPDFNKQIPVVEEIKTDDDAVYNAIVAAREKYVLGQFAFAQRLYESVLRIDPNNLVARLALEQFAAAEELPFHGLDELRKAIRAQEDKFKSTSAKYTKILTDISRKEMSEKEKVQKLQSLEGSEYIEYAATFDEGTKRFFSTYFDAKKQIEELKAQGLGDDHQDIVSSRQRMQNEYAKIDDRRYSLLRRLENMKTFKLLEPKTPEHKELENLTAAENDLLLQMRIRLEAEEAKAAGNAAVPVDPATAAIKEKLRSIIIPSIDFKDVSFEEALDQLRRLTKEHDVKEPDKEKRGVNFVISHQQASSVRIREMRVKDIPCVTALKYICDVAGFRYTVNEFAIVISPRPKAGTDDKPAAAEEAKAAVPAHPGTVINVLADGTIKIGGGKVDVTQLHEKLASMAVQNKNQPVFIRGGDGVTYKRVVEVIDTCQKAGIWNITFATQRPEPSK